MATVKDFTVWMIAAAKAEEGQALIEWREARRRFEEAAHYPDLETQEYRQILGQRKEAVAEKEATHGRWLALVGRLLKAVQEFEGKG